MPLTYTKLMFLLSHKLKHFNQFTSKAHHWDQHEKLVSHLYAENLCWKPLLRMVPRKILGPKQELVLGCGLKLGLGFEVFNVKSFGANQFSVNFFGVKPKNCTQSIQQRKTVSLQINTNNKKNTGFKPK